MSLCNPGDGMVYCSYKEAIMNKPETNGYLAAVEAQLRAVEAALDEVNRTGDLTGISFDAFREVRLDVINTVQKLHRVREWNLRG